MSFGQELKDFTAAFGAGYNIGADRRDKKAERERQALNDPIDREYKKASTESMKAHTKWYEPLAESQLRTANKNLEWADRRNQSAIDATDASIYANVFGTGRRAGKPVETLEGDTPDGAPDASGAPVGDHGPGATVDDSATDAAPDSDTGGEDTGGDETPAAENMSYKPASSQSEVYARFMRTVYDSGVKNPNGLAAIAATANRESKFAPSHAYGRWADPSESGQAGTAGGIMSWRGNRYVGLQHFAARVGDDPNRPSPETQAKYLFHEDPALKEKLNAARTPQQAQQIMNNAWAFAGYDRDSPERNARFSLANTYAEKYGQYLAEGGRVATYSEAMQGAVPVEQQALPVGQARPMYTGGGRNNTGMIAYPGAPRRQAVVHAAVGGVIPSVDDQEDPNAQQPVQVAQAAPQQALPVDNAPVPTQRPVDQPTPDQGGDTSEGNATPADVGYDPSVAGDPRVVGFTKAHEAVLDGIRYSLKQVGLAQGAAVTDPDRAAKMAEYLKGSGAAPKAIIDQAYEAVDPNKELPESERTMAALGTVYDHYIKRGEPQKAKAAAASIVQYQRKLFQQYSAIAKAATADGDIDAATKAAVKAYDSVPDGQGMKVKKLDNGRYQIEITDEATGKTISKPVLTPQEIGGWAMKVSPGSFDQFIMDAAGQRKQGGGAPSEQFQKLAAGLDEGKMPSNKDMAALPLGEQKELRMRAASAAKAAGGGESKPLTFGENQTAKAAVATAWDDMANQTETDESGNEVPVHAGMNDLKPADQSAIKSSAANMLGTPKNRSPDYNVTEQDAIIAASMVAQSEGYNVTDKDGGKVVELPDGTAVWMTKPDFTKLSNIYKREMRDAAKKAQDETNLREDNAAKSARRSAIDKKNREDRPGLLGDQSIPPSTMGGTPQKALDDLQKLMGQ